MTDLEGQIEANAHYIGAAQYLGNKRFIELKVCKDLIKAHLDREKAERAELADELRRAEETEQWGDDDMSIWYEAFGVQLVIHKLEANAQPKQEQSRA